MSVSLPQIPLRAVFMRGGTSRALFFRAEDLPEPGPVRDAMILAAMDSPDPNKRQLDGMGAGTSSTSKIAIIAKSTSSQTDIPAPTPLGTADFKSQVAGFEIKLLRQALRQNANNQTEAAKALDLNYHQLRRLLEKHDLLPER